MVNQLLKKSHSEALWKVTLLQCLHRWGPTGPFFAPQMSPAPKMHEPQWGLCGRERRHVIRRHRAPHSLLGAGDVATAFTLRSPGNNTFTTEVPSLFCPFNSPHILSLFRHLNPLLHTLSFVLFLEAYCTTAPSRDPRLFDPAIREVGYHVSSGIHSPLNCIIKQWHFIEIPGIGRSMRW